MSNSQTFISYLLILCYYDCLFRTPLLFYLGSLRNIVAARLNVAAEGTDNIYHKIQQSM